MAEGYAMSQEPITDPTYTSRTEKPEYGGGYKKTGLSQKELLKRYRQRIETSRRWREDFDNVWDRMVDLYRGKQFLNDSTEDRVAVNIAKSTVDVIWPSVSVNHPKIMVEARKEEYDASAAITQAIVNYWWRHYEYKDEMRMAVKDMLIVGHGWVKVGWTFRTQERPLNEEEMMMQVQELDAQAQEFADANPDLAAELPSPEDIVARIPETTVDVVKDCPFVERVSFKDILVDPEATCEEDLKWMAQRLVVPLEQAQKNKAYKQSARSKLKPDSSTNPRWRDTERSTDSSESYSDDIKRVTLWEFYDLQHGVMCVFADHAEHGEFLVAPTDFPYAFGKPFVMIRNYDVPDQFYPIGELEALEPLQHELNKTRSAMMQHRKKYARKYVVRREALTPEGRRALESDKDNAIVWVDGDQGDPSQIVVPVAQTPLDVGMYNYSDVIEADIENVSGVTDYQRGSMSETRRTATEASIIQDASNARAAEKLGVVEIFIREISERLVALAQTNMQGEDVAHIVGPANAMLWVPFTREDIQGEFDFEVEAGSTQPRNEMFRRQQALQLAQILGPYVGVAVNPVELVRYVLKEGFGIRNAERFLIDPMMMLAQQQAAGEEGEEGQEGGAPPDAGSLPLGGMDAVPAGARAQLQGQTGLDMPGLGGTI